MKRVMFRFKVIDEYGSILYRGLCSNILHSDKWLFEYVRNGRVVDSSKATFNDFVSRAFVTSCDVVLESCYNADSVPFNHKIPEYV